MEVRDPEAAEHAVFAHVTSAGDRLLARMAMSYAPQHASMTK